MTTSTTQLGNYPANANTKQKGILDFTRQVNGNYVMTQLKNVLGKNAGTFATSLIEVFTNDSQLQRCDTKKVLQEAVKAATLKLPLNKQLGYSYILVFNQYNKETRQSEPTPQLVIGYKGYIQLAMRTGQYRNINADVVYEGEFTGFDKLTGGIRLDGTPTSKRVIGYFAHFELINGFTKMLFMTLQDMAAYALAYSPSFKRNPEKNPIPSVDKLCDIANEQAANGAVQGKVGWEGNFNSMAKKTVLRRLLSTYGYLSIEMMDALDIDERQTAQQIRDEINEEEKKTFDASAIVEEIEDTKNDPGDCPV